MTTAQALISIMETAYNSGDVEQLLELYHDDVRLTDHLFGLVSVDKSVIRSVFSAFFKTSRDVSVTTRCISGTPNLVAWESDIRGEAKEDFAALGIAQGEKYLLRGVSLTSWRDERIVEEKDYFLVVRSGGGGGGGGGVQQA